MERGIIKRGREERLLWGVGEIVMGRGIVIVGLNKEREDGKGWEKEMRRKGGRTEGRKHIGIMNTIRKEEDKKRGDTWKRTREG